VALRKPTVVCETQIVVTERHKTLGHMSTAHAEQDHFNIILRHGGISFINTVQTAKTVITTKQSRYTPWWRLGGEEIHLLLILDLGTRWG
jgi:hypothetical protein